MHVKNTLQVGYGYDLKLGRGERPGGGEAERRVIEGGIVYRWARERLEGCGGSGCLSANEP